MRLGKKKSDKEKDSESSKSQVVEGINRLVCQAKTHHSLLKGMPSFSFKMLTHFQLVCLLLL